MSKPIVLYSHASGPNPWRVAIMLEELGLPYETKFMDMAVLHQPDFERLNPNGRVPVIDDPNTGIILWESAAITEYLMETYDKSNNLSYGDKFPEKWFCKQWLAFQISGQGPYFGQRAWFALFHPEKNLTSAIERYGNEIKRVVGVLDSHLKKNGTGWLVGDKCTYADLAFIPWDAMIPMLLGAENDSLMQQHPHYQKWHETMMARPAVAKVMEAKQKASQHH